MISTNNQNDILNVEHKSPIDFVYALQTMLSDIDGFMVDWFQRLNQQLEASDTVSSPDQKLKLQMEDFLREQNEWKLKREREDEQIREKFQQLSDAWLMLESEQRKLLQVKNSRACASSESQPQPAPAQATEPKATHSPAVVATPIAAQSIASSPTISSPESSSSEYAIRQFQRLRQEIQSLQKL